ncbi:hypothetical protein [Sphingomonas sp. OTU376]|uniref:hypothetical protein n=1 Tax=Sphingomonas sp. OTU376 TaxID=3043863 RepID=UPI00313F1BDA
MLLTALALLAAGAADCRHIGESLRAARYDREVLRPDDETNIEYVYRDGPDGEKVIPQRCIADLAVKGPARLRGRQRLLVRSDAKGGEEIALSMRIGGMPYSRTVKVTGRDQQVLTGTWHVVESQHCRTKLPSEIRFFDNGGYDFTYPEAMVETMTSGSGSYTWHQASGALSLGGEWRGTARFEGRRLVMVGPYFDSAYVPGPGEILPPPCRIVLG